MTKYANSSERSECTKNIVQKPKTENKICSFCIKKKSLTILMFTKMR